MKSWFFKRALIVVSTLTAAACVPFPTALPEGKPFEDVTANFFSLGSTSVSEVEEKLGEPQLRGKGWRLYRDTRNGWQWAFCVGGGYSAGCGSLPRGKADYFLVVDLDEKDLVSAVTLYSENKLCDKRRICYEGEALMHAARAAEDTAAKQFRVPPVGCSVYIWSTTDSDSAAGEMFVDGEALGGLIGTSGFYYHEVAQGTHEWVVVPPRDRMLPLLVARTSIECEGRQAIYLRYRYGFWGVKIEGVDARRGRQEILERWLAISSPESNEMLQKEPGH